MVRFAVSVAAEVREQAVEAHLVEPLAERAHALGRAGVAVNNDDPDVARLVREDYLAVDIAAARGDYLHLCGIGGFKPLHAPLSDLVISALLCLNFLGYRLLAHGHVENNVAQSEICRTDCCTCGSGCYDKLFG